MKVEALNGFFRTLFKKFIDDGYKKRQICTLTLGSQSEPQLENFLKGRDFGLKPLTRLIEAFNYDIELIVIPKDDAETRKSIENINKKSLADCKSKLVDALNNQIKTKQEKTSITKSIVEQLVKELIEQ